MKISKCWAVYFSATGTTQKIVTRIADTAAKKLSAEREDFDFTLPIARADAISFSGEDLVVFGTPVYAGRVPNILLPYLKTVSGGGALAIPVVLFGNRDYDDALIELRDITQTSGFHSLAAAAFVGEHSFSRILAGGRPDEKDMEIADDFAAMAAEKLAALSDPSALPPIDIKGVPYPYRGYYTPRDRKGSPVDIRKVKPLTSAECVGCKTCAGVCPMGSISPENVRELSGICIKCGACIKKCPKGAKFYDDERYLYHQHELEEALTRRAEPALYL